MVRLHPPQLLRALLTVAALLVAISTVAQLANHRLDGRAGMGLVARVLNIDSEQSIPTAWSASVLASCAVVAWVIAGIHRRRDLGQHRSWAALGAVAAVVAADEFLAVHETSIDPLRGVLGERATGLLYYAWVLPGLVVALVVAAVFWRFVWSLPVGLRSRLVIAGVLYLTGAVGFEMLGGAQDEDHTRVNGTYLALNGVEEGLEMVAASVVLAALVGYLLGPLGGVDLSLRAGSSSKVTADDRL